MALPALMPGDPGATFSALAAWKAAIDDVINGLDAERSGRVTVDVSLGNQINALRDAVNTAIDAERVGRVNVDVSLGSQINSVYQGLADSLSAVDTFLRGQIAGKADISAAVATANGLDDAVLRVATLERDLPTKANSADLAPLRASLAALAKLIATKATTLDVATLGSGLATVRGGLSNQANRPGTNGLAFTFVDRPARLGGAPDTLPDMPGSLVAFGSDGPVARLTAPGTLASRLSLAIEPTRLYQIRAVVRRRVNTEDPANDAVLVGLSWLDQAGNLLLSPSSTPVATLTTFVKEDGRRLVQATFSRTNGPAVDFVVPANARGARAFVQSLATTGAIDVEVLGLTDITDLAAPAPVTADVEARLGALESEDPIPRISALETQVQNPGSLTFPTRPDAVAAVIPAGVTTLVLRGYVYAGDGRGRTYRRVAAPITSAYFQSKDGAYWQRVDKTVTDADIDTVGAQSIAFQQLQSSLSRTVLDDAREFLKLTQFPFVYRTADGSTPAQASDDGFRLALAAAKQLGKRLLIPAGGYRLDEDHVYENADCLISGEGEGRSRIFYGGVGCPLSINQDGGFRFTEVVGLDIYPVGTGPAANPLVVTYPEISSFAHASVRIRVRAFDNGGTAANGWAGSWNSGFKLANTFKVDLSYSSVQTRIDIYDQSGNVVGRHDGSSCIEIGGGRYGSVLLDLTSFAGYYAHHGILATAYVETLKLAYSEFVGVTRGLSMNSAPLGGFFGAIRGLSIWANKAHFNAIERGLDLDRVSNITGDYDIQRYPSVFTGTWIACSAVNCDGIIALFEVEGGQPSGPSQALQINGGGNHRIELALHNVDVGAYVDPNVVRSRIRIQQSNAVPSKGVDLSVNLSPTTVIELMRDTGEVIEQAGGVGLIRSPFLGASRIAAWSQNGAAPRELALYCQGAAAVTLRSRAGSPLFSAVDLGGASAPTNFVQAEAYPSGNAAVLRAAGGDTNVSMVLAAKGQGIIAAVSPLSLPAFLTTTLPSAIAFAGGMIRLDDRAGRPAYASGGSWRFTDGTPVS